MTDYYDVNLKNARQKLLCENLNFYNYKGLVQDTELLNEIYSLAQGGTAVGTGINSKKNFDKKIINEIKKITKLPFKPTKNKFAALAAHDADAATIGPT